MLDFISFLSLESILSKCSLNDILNFMCLSKEHFEIYYKICYKILEEKIKEPDDNNLAYVRSHGYFFMKEMARKELLERYPQLIPLNNDTICQVVVLINSDLLNYGMFQK